MKLIGFRSTILLALSCFILNHTSWAQKPWREIVTVEDLCSSYPDEMRKMLDHFDLDYSGMDMVKAAHVRGDLVATCKALLEYYENGTSVVRLRRDQPPMSEKTLDLADTILNNVFVVQNVRGQVPYGADGHRDWYYKGPNNDREWAWLSNRHSQVSQVFLAFMETGNPKYAIYIDELLRDFIIKSMPYPGVKSGTSVWRGLEVAARAKVWSRIFFGMLNSPYLSPATRLLMLSSFPDHAHYNRNFHGGNNWLTMEISALATVATNFPEYRDAEEWLEYSIGAMVESMKGQVYADGVQTELTSHYHNVSMFNFQLFKEICDQAGRELPEFYNKTIEDMYSYIAHAMRPDGYRMLNNDGDRGLDREIILKGAEIYGNEEWKYIASNGSMGKRPMEGPSYFYPWAGHLISRSGYDPDAQWSFFDVGPWGSGHQHNDKLHLSIAAYGRDLLVDAGRFAYTGATAEKFRPYAKGTQGHNLLLIDGFGQSPGPKLAEKPLDDGSYRITPDFDFATSAFDQFQDAEGQAVHNRSLLYVRGQFWVVVDRVVTDRPRQIDAFWHWHPSCEVELDGQITRTNNDRGNLSIFPVGTQHFDVEFIEGQEEPEIQGWYSSEYNIFEPNIATRYSANVDGSTTFVWLLLPSEKGAELVGTKIVSQDENQVQLQVKVGGRNWDLTIPYGHSEGVNLRER